MLLEYKGYTLKVGFFIFKKILIIGGGIAGLSSAISLCKKGFSSNDIFILEREAELGGTLKYNLDGNYGLITFDSFVTSYEFLNFLIEDLESLKVEYLLNTCVTSINDKKVSVISKDLGKIDIEFEILIIATGSKQILNLHSYIYDDNILKSLSTGVFFQKNISINGLLLSKDILITGTSSRELFLAKRTILEGGSVKGIIEKGDKIVSNDLGLINFMKVNKVNIYLNSVIEKITKTHLGFQNYLDVLININSKNHKNILCGKIICPFKYLPETKFLNDYVETGDLNEITINDKFMTSKKGIFSIGNSCNLYTNTDSIYVDSDYLAQSVLDFVNGKNNELDNIEICYDKKEIKLITPKYITNKKDQKHLIILLSQKNISKNIKVMINNEEFFDFRVLRFENYIEILLNLELYLNEINKVNILLN